MRTFPFLAGALALAAVLIGPGAAAQEQPPSFVVIVTDDQAFDAIGPTHSADGATPVMPTVQDLADQGIRFENAFVTTALCGPSRAALLTGLRASTSGILQNGPPWGGALHFDDASTVATWLDDAGYRTGLYGFYLFDYAKIWPHVPPGWDEWHAVKSGDYYDFFLYENGEGIDHQKTWYGSGCASYDKCPGDLGGCEAPVNHQVEVLQSKVLEFLDAQPADEPFFLLITPFAPHRPACAAPADRGSFADVPDWRPPNHSEADASDKPPWVQADCPMGQGFTRAIDEDRRRQLASLQVVDRAVDAVHAKLEETGRDQDTVLVFTSDNGFRWGEHCRRGKFCPYEECIRVPMVVYGEGIVETPRVESRPVLLIDLAPTLAELAGAAPGGVPDGLSLAPLLQEPPGAPPGDIAWRSDFVYEQWRMPDAAGKPPNLGALRSEDWKYVLHETGDTELYDLVGDPYELQNLSGTGAHAAVEADLAALLAVDGPAPGCADGFDNDLDGTLDFPDDPGCDDEDDLSERSTELRCDDGLDNDGDGAIDFPDDPDCPSGAGMREAAHVERSGCGLGFELVLLVPLWRRARRLALGDVPAKLR